MGHPFEHQLHIMSDILEIILDITGTSFGLGVDIVMMDIIVDIVLNMTGTSFGDR